MHTHHHNEHEDLLSDHKKASEAEHHAIDVELATIELEIKKVKAEDDSNLTKFHRLNFLFSEKQKVIDKIGPMHARHEAIKAAHLAEMQAHVAHAKVQDVAGSNDVAEIKSAILKHKQKNEIKHHALNKELADVKERKYYAADKIARGFFVKYYQSVLKDLSQTEATLEHKIRENKARYDVIDIHSQIKLADAESKLPQIQPQVMSAEANPLTQDSKKYPSNTELRGNYDLNTAQQLLITAPVVMYLTYKYSPIVRKTTYLLGKGYDFFAKSAAKLLDRGPGLPVDVRENKKTI